jgi:uroporphyrinogen-III synthase
VGDLNLSPLAGKRVVVTRAAEQSGELVQELIARGTIPVLLPLLSFAAPEDAAPMDEALAELAEFDWVIFTSVNAVRAVATRATSLSYREDQFARVKSVAAVGPATAEAAKKAGFRVDYVPTTHNGLALAQELGERVRGKRVFLPRSDRANPELPAALKQFGARVTEVVAYRTVPPNSTEQRKWKEMLEGGADAVLFFSPTAVQHFAELLGEEQLRAAQDTIAMVAIGPITAKALREANVWRMTVPSDTTPAAAVDALEEYFAEKEKQIHAGVKRV